MEQDLAEPPDRPDVVVTRRSPNRGRSLIFALIGLVGLSVGVLGLAQTACRGCIGSSAPDQVRPTLAGWKSIGLRCDDPTRDDATSDDLQWNCRGVFDGVELSGTMDGDEGGVFSIHVVVPAATPPEEAIDAFRQVLDATPQLADNEAVIASFISDWPGPATIGFFAGARVRAAVDDTWRSVAISLGPRRDGEDTAPTPAPS